MKMVKGYTPLEALYFDYAYGKTHVWIFSKNDLKLVKKVDYVGTPFFMFHFTNGYADKEKIVVEYAKYPG
jgi:carotenoid cleavage dioxygenase-like enzyme